METIRMNVHSQEYMETMARLMSEALESPEGMRARRRPPGNRGGRFRFGPRLFG